MQRRELSRYLLASSAAAAVATQATAATQSATGSAFPQTPAEGAAAVTPTNLTFLQGDIRRYGADPTGVVDSTTAIQSALKIVGDVLSRQSSPRIIST